MAAAQHNLIISRGADFSFDLRIADANENLVPLTGGSTSFKSQIRDSFKQRIAATFDIVVVEGELRFTLTDEQTLQLQPQSNYEWDFFWGDTLGTVRRVLYGSVEVVKNITHLT